MAILLQEDFTTADGGNGAPWSGSNWQTPLSPQTAAGTTFTLQSNAGRVSTPGSFGGGARNTTLTARADVVIQATLFLPTQGSIRFAARERANGSATDDRLCVAVNVSRVFNEVQLTDYTVGQFFPNQPAADRRFPIPSMGTSNRLIVELALSGSTGELRAWTPETSRPSSAQVTATGLTNVSGNVGLAVGNQNAATWDVDSITVSDAVVAAGPVKDVYVRQAGSLVLARDRYRLNGALEA